MKITPFMSQMLARAVFVGEKDGEEFYLPRDYSFERKEVLFADSCPEYSTNIVDENGIYMGFVISKDRDLPSEILNIYTRCIMYARSGDDFRIISPFRWLA